MRKLVMWACDVADRIAPLLALIGLVAALVMLAEANDARHVFWALMALALACVAMWAFWGDGDA
jgi:asparagine N-glycosylation enzyme membrane subunit Stt3